VKVRKKPIVLDAWRYATTEETRALPSWVVAAVLAGTMLPNEPDRSCVIKTLEGDHLAREGDVIMCGTRGELWPIKAEIFAETYDVLSE
jgi:hypothetical protein